MASNLNLSDHVFGKLTVLNSARKIYPGGRNIPGWLCRCACGVEKVFAVYELRSGRCVSCGCDIKRRIKTGLHTIHGYARQKRVYQAEYRSAYNHWMVIVAGKCTVQSHEYAGLPFYDQWNPKCGGSLGDAARWIVENLGPRPSRHHQLAIINHDEGFVPNNLAWWTRRENMIEAHIRHADDSSFERVLQIVSREISRRNKQKGN